ncbi:MAG: hypothetical protein J6L59_04490 [Clostridia bacterium]|nr:hypothetical protein [Clostridia bacterium]
MKKLFITILSTVMMLLIAISVSAANGDIAGYIYSTDICAFINGVEVESYNIGGKTAVVIEDILHDDANFYYIYDDSARTLKFSSLNPSRLVEKSGESKSKPGKIIGKIYETDIKTSIYDVVIPSYNLNGKTAVAIEDLGYDREFSPIGGRYFWNEKERKIELEFLYPTQNFLPYSRTADTNAGIDIHIKPNDDMTEADATFEEKFHCGGGQEYFDFPEGADKSPSELIMPIKANGETIGYYFRIPTEEYNPWAFTYYYPDKIKEASKKYTPYPKKTREEIISHFTYNHSVGEPRERFDTDNFSFVYISVAGTSWTSYNLLQAFDDGTYIDYGNLIGERNRSPINLVIDQENEKVTFRHIDRYTREWYTDYEIDLKKAKIKAINNLETDIGTGTSDGQVAEEKWAQSRNEQYEYKLVSGEEEKIVKGFFAHEYYYADMLPLKETFDFLNIKYSFENDVLTIDTTEARAFSIEKTENKTDAMGENPPEYLYVEKVLLNGEETQITFPYISGHFDNTNYGRTEAKPYVCNGIVYINSSFIASTK